MRVCLYLLIKKIWILNYIIFFFFRMIELHYLEVGKNGMFNANVLELGRMIVVLVLKSCTLCSIFKFLLLVLLLLSKTANM